MRATAGILLYVSVGWVIYAQTSARPANAPPVEIGTADGQPLFKPRADHDTAVTLFRQRNHRAPVGSVDEKIVARGLAHLQCTEIEGQLGAVLTAKLEKQYSIHVGDAEAEALIGKELGQLQPQAESAAKLPGENIRVNRDAVHAALVRSFRPLLEKRKLDALVDGKIASSDPQFKAYLEEETRATVWKTPIQKSVSGMKPEHESYLQTKRNAWWSARKAELKVQLNDPELARQCGLP